MPDPQPDADPESVARAIGLRLLERSPRTRAELATAMAKRAVPDDVATRVLDRFVEVGLLDDAAFATAWVDSRHHARGLSRRALAVELRRRGIDAEVAGDVLSGVSNEDEVTAARALVERRLRAMSGLSADVQLRRLTGMLARKGFGASLAYRVAREAIEQHAGFLDDLHQSP